MRKISMKNQFYTAQKTAFYKQTQEEPSNYENQIIEQIEDRVLELSSMVKYPQNIEEGIERARTEPIDLASSTLAHTLITLIGGIELEDGNTAQAVADSWEEAEEIAASAWGPELYAEIEAMWYAAEHLDFSKLETIWDI